MNLFNSNISKSLKKMGFTVFGLSLVFIISSYSLLEKQQSFFDIPSQSVNLFSLLGHRSVEVEQSIKGFQISEQITYKEYKVYLNSTKKDSSEAFYLSQLPDVNIAAPDIRNKYLSSSEYDNFPVLGISWNSAMNFCKWKTLQENQGKIDFIYRLPLLSEWLAAYHHLQNKGIKHDFNKNYSDWLLNSQKHELFYIAPTDDNQFPLDYFYFHEKNDPKLKTHKLAIGNSYLFNHQSFIAFLNHKYYAQEGYRQISFRIVKVPIVSRETKKESIQLTNRILNYWEVK